jgi:hypothetical protein
MRLKLTAGDSDDHFQAGYTAQLSLGGVDVSRYVSRVVVECEGNNAIRATVECLLTELEIDLPAVVEAIDITPTREEALHPLASLGSLPARIPTHL